MQKLLSTFLSYTYSVSISLNKYAASKELQVLCGRLDFIHIYAQRKLIFISKLGKLNNDM